jgi:hypothetical protein
VSKSNNFITKILIISLSLVSVLFAVFLSLHTGWFLGNQVEKEITQSVIPEDKNSRFNKFYTTPNGSLIGYLDSQLPLQLPNGVILQTLLESPNPGLIEVGISVSGTKIRKEDFILVTIDGRTFRPDDINFDQISGFTNFTINAEINNASNFKIIWSSGGRLIATLFSQKQFSN